ncbi:hypothetical protein Trydic_g17624 [Trypoxylus dichotomus]
MRGVCCVSRTVRYVLRDLSYCCLKLQQHWIVVRRELVENGQLVELGDVLQDHDIQDVGLSVVQEYRGLDDSVYQKVEVVRIHGMYGHPGGLEYTV